MKRKIPSKYKWKVKRKDGYWDYYETKAKAKRLGFTNIIRKR